MDRWEMLRALGAVAADPAAAATLGLPPALTLTVLPEAPCDRVQQWWADRAAHTAWVLRSGDAQIARVSAAD